MDRKNFFKNACTLGICSCIGVGLASGENLSAIEDNVDDWKERFIKLRFAKLLDILDVSLDEDIKNKILENLGKECSKNSLAVNFQNNPDGFFNEIHKRWGENASYDKDKELIRIETPERDCFCPFVDSKIISKSVCQCSIGWQKQTYNTILGKDADVTLIESVVRGGKKCVFEVRLRKNN